MADFEIKVEGLADLLRTFDVLPGIAADELGKAMDRALLLLQGDMADYPPPPPGSTYRRTGTLGRRWTSARREVEITGGMLQGRVGNNTPYGPYVQDPAQQAQVHRGRWQTTADVVDDRRDDIQKILDRMIQDLEKRVSI